MALQTNDTKASTGAVPSGRSRLKRLIIALTVVAFLIIGAFVLYAISLIVGAVVLLLVSALLAYIIYPLTQLLQRRLQHPLAIAVAYLLAALVLAVGLSIVISSLLRQSLTLVQNLQFLLSPAGARQNSWFFDFLNKLGITNNQVAMFKNQLLAQVLNGLSGILPFLSGLISNMIDCIVAIVLSVYFVLDGPRIVRWLWFKTPVAQRDTIHFLLRTLDQSLGGYFRSTVLLALLGAICTGMVLALLHVQYAALLGTLFFLLYFLPVIGAIMTALVCVLAALSQGWVVMLIVALFLALLGLTLGLVVSPRLFSKELGVHPIVAVFALFAGGELFGLLGGLLSVPIAGVLQQIIVAAWHRWEQKHPEQFPPEEVSPQPSASLPGQEAVPTDTAASSIKR